jgi:hypothetical protein
MTKIRLSRGHMIRLLLSLDHPLSFDHPRLMNKESKLTVEPIINPVAEFIDPGLGDEFNSGIGLSHGPASPCSLSGRYYNHIPEMTLSPQSGSFNSATAHTVQHMPRLTAFVTRILFGI